MKFNNFASYEDRERVLGLFSSVDDLIYNLPHDRYLAVLDQNRINNRPKVVVKGNMLFFYCQLCKSIHTVNISNYKRDKYNFSDDNLNWLWNENFTAPTLDHCVHTPIVRKDQEFRCASECKIQIMGGYIYNLALKANNHAEARKCYAYEKTRSVAIYYPMLSVDQWPIKI
jgi:hypothetical protein